jgi:hypothetical protein
VSIPFKILTLAKVAAQSSVFAGEKAPISLENQRDVASPLRPRNIVATFAF